MTRTVAFLHYSAPPIVGGVESVMLAHLRLFIDAGYSTSVLAGKGDKTALPLETDLIRIPELDGGHPAIVRLSQKLEQGQVSPDFYEAATYLESRLAFLLSSIDLLIVHNVFTKHFNLPLTAALFRLLDKGRIRRCVAWCHDVTWASPTSRSKVFPGYPWDLLRTFRSDLTYVTVSQERRRELSNVFDCAPEHIRVIYNGVDSAELLALSTKGQELTKRLGMWDSDLNLIMPVRVTKAKNIELALKLTAALKQKGIIPKLVVTGPPDPYDRASMEYFESLRMLRKELGVTDEVSFIFESGPVSAEPFIVDMHVVAELLRVSDALFMPSYREGFGMPVLEAGLLGLPVFSADSVPSAQEIARENVTLFSAQADAGQVADLIYRCMEDSPTYRLRRHIRQTLTWQGIFRQQILPLLVDGIS